MVGYDPHTVLNLHHGHRRTGRQNVRHLALALRIEMQNDYERATAVGRHGIEEPAERLNAARRRANADDGNGWPRGVVGTG